MLALLILGVLVISWSGYQQIQVKNGFSKIRIGKATVQVIVRDTVEGRRQGLSGFDKLEENEGMLFVFPVASRYSFWMKGMKFDLDFVWIKDNKVVEITEGVKAPSEDEVPVKVQPEMGVNKVLEVNSGWAKKNKIKVGDEVSFGRS